MYIEGELQYYWLYFSEYNFSKILKIKYCLKRAPNQNFKLP
jgi:hypothetical protein